MHTKENFDSRNKIKQRIHMRKEPLYYIKPGEIRYTYLWLNIGHEACGKWKWFTRPVLVLKKLWSLFLVIPMTTKWKRDNVFYYMLDDKYFWFPSFLQLTQPRIIDKKRFTKHLSTLVSEDFIKLKQKLREYYL